MGFIIIGVLAFLIIVVFRKNRTIFSVVMTSAMLAGATTAVLLWGRAASDGQPAIHFFNIDMGTREFYHLMAAWYAMDLLCSVIIIRRYIEYRKINSGLK
jgi:hypothetical protein